MAELRKILISVPDSLLKEVDTFVSLENTNRSEFVRKAMRCYIRERRKSGLRDIMKKGYQEMAEIELKLAEFCFEADNEMQLKYERQLAECD